MIITIKLKCKDALKNYLLI